MQHEIKVKANKKPPKKVALKTSFPSLDVCWAVYRKLHDKNSCKYAFHVILCHSEQQTSAKQ